MSTAFIPRHAESLGAVADPAPAAAFAAAAFMRNLVPDQGGSLAFGSSPTASA